ncbi:MAG: transposase [Akkermansia sp.]
MGRRLNDGLIPPCPDEHLGCERYKRMSTRNGQRNGFKARTIRTSTGQITLDVPQVRNSQTPFSPIILGFERGSRMDRSLTLAIAEMYLQGVSTRKVAKVMNEICGGNRSAYGAGCFRRAFRSG